MLQLIFIALLAVPEAYKNDNDGVPILWHYFIAVIFPIMTIIDFIIETIRNGKIEK